MQWHTRRNQISSFGETDESISIGRGGGGSVQSTTGSRGVRISDNNAGYTMFRGSVKSISYPLHSPVSPSLPLPCVIMLHHVSTGLYLYTLLATAKPSPVACSTTLRYVGVVSGNIILFINGIFRLAAILREEKSEKTVSTNMGMKINTNATEHFHLLREVLGEGNLSIARVFECPERFSTGREDVEDNEEPDRQVTTKTDGNVEKMGTHVYEQIVISASEFKFQDKYKV